MEVTFENTKHLGFECTSYVHENGNSKKRKHCSCSVSEYNSNLNNQNKNKALLFLPCSSGIFHSDQINMRPYNCKEKTNETLYCPLQENIFVNIKAYDEILLKDGHYFLTDTDGKYERTAQASAVHLLKFSSHSGPLYIARSFVFDSKAKAEEVANYLLMHL